MNDGPTTPGVRCASDVYRCSARALSQTYVRATASLIGRICRQVSSLAVPDNLAMAHLDRGEQKSVYTFPSGRIRTSYTAKLP